MSPTCTGRPWNDPGHLVDGEVVALLTNRLDGFVQQAEQSTQLLVRNLARVEQEYETLHSQWQVASTLLPEQNEMSDLLRKVTAAGKQSGIEFKLFRPEPTVGREFYTDNPVSVRVQGGYHQTGVFLSRLANLNRIVNVGSLRMEGLSGQNQKINFTVETEMLLTAYTLSGGAPEAPDGQQQLASAEDGSQTQTQPSPARASH